MTPGRWRCSPAPAERSAARSASISSISDGRCATGSTGAAVDRLMQAAQQAHGPFRPDRPVAEQPAAEADADGIAVAHRHDGRHQIEDDVVVIAGIERDAPLGAGGDQPAHYVERALAME